MKEKLKRNEWKKKTALPFRTLFSPAVDEKNAEKYWRKVQNKTALGFISQSQIRQHHFKTCRGLFFFPFLKIYALCSVFWRRARGSRSDKRKEPGAAASQPCAPQESGSRNVQPAAWPASLPHLNSFPFQSSDHRLIYGGSHWSSLRFVYVGKAWRRSMKTRSRFSHVGGRERVTQSRPAAGMLGLGGNPCFMQLRPNPSRINCPQRFEEAFTEK